MEVRPAAAGNGRGSSEVSMNIRFEKSGGFAGIKRPPTTIDGTTLPAEKAAEWQRLLEEADFFHLPEVIAPGPERDRFQYQVTAELDGRRHTVRVSEGSVPPALQPLIDRLKQTP
jgi:hypothetical protein